MNYTVVSRTGEHLFEFRYRVARRDFVTFLPVEKSFDIEAGERFGDLTASACAFGLWWNYERCQLKI